MFFTEVFVENAPPYTSTSLSKPGATVNLVTDAPVHVLNRTKILLPLPRVGQGDVV